MTEASSLALDEQSPGHAGAHRKPPGWLFHTFLVMACFVVLWGAGFPGLPWFPFLLPGIVAVVALSLVWFARAVLCLDTGVAPRWPLAFAPLIVSLTVLAVCTAVPLHVRFDLSRSAFEAKAADTTACSDVRVGLYAGLSCLGSKPYAVAFYSGDPMAATSGFAYLSPGTSLSSTFDPSEFEVIDLGDGWIAWSRYGPIPESQIGSEDS